MTKGASTHASTHALFQSTQRMRRRMRLRRSGHWEKIISVFEIWKRKTVFEAAWTLRTFLSVTPIF